MSVSYFKVFSCAVDIKTIGRQEEILRKILTAFSGSMVSPSDISWFRFKHQAPCEIPLQCVIPPPRSAQKWIASNLANPVRKLFGVESFLMNLNKQAPSRTHNFFKALFLKLVELGVLEKIPSRSFPRLFFYEATPNDERITANSDWHVDFLQYKKFDEIDDLVSKNTLYCICTLTSSDGPRTWLLNACDIEIPVLHLDGKDRSYIINAYIDALIHDGMVSAEPLKANTWYLLHSNHIHRGPRFSQDGFNSSDRAFLHVTGIPESKGILVVKR
jgi:hypothetical protein